MQQGTNWGWDCWFGFVVNRKSTVYEQKNKIGGKSQRKIFCVLQFSSQKNGLGKQAEKKNVPNRKPQMDWMCVWINQFPSLCFTVWAMRLRWSSWRVASSAGGFGVAVGSCCSWSRRLAGTGPTAGPPLNGIFIYYLKYYFNLYFFKFSIFSFF